MKFKSIAQTLVAGLTFSSAIALTSQSASAGPTTFQCVQAGSGYATIAVASSGRRTNPLITWNSRAFGPEFTPQVRCQIVTQRLNTAVGNNGGKFSNLLLTTGRVRGSDVICYVNNEQGSCNQNNLLLTLAPGTYAKPGDALAALLNVRASAGASGTALLADIDIALVQEQGISDEQDIPDEPAGSQQTYLKFGEAVEQELSAAEDSVSPSPKTSPEQPFDPSAGSYEPI